MYKFCPIKYVYNKARGKITQVMYYHFRQISPKLSLLFFYYPIII